MTDQSSKYIPQFYITAPSPCPYVEDKMERKVFTSLSGPLSDQFHNQLVQDGFRRSQGIAYKPACEECSACISVRIIVDDFNESGTDRYALSAFRVGFAICGDGDGSLEFLVLP